MPVSVHIPARFRIDQSVLEDRVEEAAAAYAATLGRALKASREAVLKPRGAYVRVAASAMDATWWGEGLAKIPTPVRQALEKALARALEDELTRSGIPDWGRIESTGRPSAAESLDPARWDAEQGTYHVPCYDKKGAPKPVPAHPKSADDNTETIVVLGQFASYDEVYAAIKAFYRDATPKGNTLYGVYGTWSADGKHYLFWVLGLLEEGPKKGSPLFAALHLVNGKVERGKFISTGQPMVVDLGAKYVVDFLLERKEENGVPYGATLRKESESKTRPLYQIEPFSKGKSIHFGVARSEETVYVIPVTASAAPAAPPPAPVAVSPLPPVFAYSIDINPIPDEGFPAWLWWWFVWFNVLGPEVRRNPNMIAVFTDWENWGWKQDALDLNWLFIYVYHGKIYKHFCRHLALKMLEASRTNMAAFKVEVAKPEWKDRVAIEMDVLREPARELSEIRHIEDFEKQLANLSKSPGRGIAPIHTDWGKEQAAKLRARIAAAEKIRYKLEDLAGLVELFQAMDPVLMVLTVKGGKQVALEDAIVQVSGLSGQQILDEIKSNIDWMIAQTWEATGKITSDFGIAHKLKIVQTVANEQLKQWLDASSAFKKVVDNVTSTSWAEWLALGIAALVLTFLFPPVGLALGAGLGVTAAVTSTRAAIELSKLSKARLAQYGFAGLASEQEVDAAVFAAVLDVFFAVLDLGALGKGIASATAKGLERAAAKEAVGVLGQRLEKFVGVWRQFDKWPEAMRSELRNTLISRLEKQGFDQVKSAAHADQVFSALQGEMLARYERHLIEFQSKFGRALEAGELSARDVDAMRKWMLQEWKHPKRFMAGLLDELQPGKRLWDDIVGRHLAGLPLPERQAAEFFAGMNAADITAFAESLGDLRQILRPNRLAALAAEAGLTTNYRTLGAQLNALLSRFEQPAEALAKLENLLARRADSAVILEGLGRSTNPRRTLDALLTPRVLDTNLAGRTFELMEALNRPAASNGRVIRIVADLDEAHKLSLFRQVETPSGRVVEQWKDLSQGWVAAPKAKFTDPVAGAAKQALSAADETKALSDLAALATELRPSGGLTSAAERAKDLLPKIKGTPVEGEIARLFHREGKAVAAKVVDGLAQLLEGGVKGRELEGLAEFLKNTQNGTLAAEILGRGTRQGGAIYRDSIRGFLEKALTFRPGDFKGVHVAFEARGGGLAGAEAVLDIAKRFDPPRSVFGALNDLAPHSEGMSKVVGYLKSISPDLNKAASAQLAQTADLLREFPGSRIVFEAPVTDAAGTLIREIDIRIVSPVSRVTILDAEIKEISATIFVEGSRARQQFARDIVESVKSARTTGAKPLGRFRWYIRQQEILNKQLADMGVDAAKATQVEIQAAKDEIMKKFKGVFEKAFTRGEMSQLTQAELDAAKLDFAARFPEIVRLF